MHLRPLGGTSAVTDIVCALQVEAHAVLYLGPEPHLRLCK